MVAADDDGGLEFARGNHLVERQAQPVAVAQADPADPGGQALEGDPVPRHVEPGMQVPVVVSNDLLQNLEYNAPQRPPKR